MKYLCFQLYILFALALAAGCSPDKKSPHEEKQDTDFVKEKIDPAKSRDSVPVTPTLFEITYHYLALDSVLITKLKHKFSEAEMNIILAVNRIDFDHVWRADTLIIPDTFSMDFNRYSPFPDSIFLISPLPKLIFFSYRLQAYGVYENGCLERWGPTSMGKRSTPTPTGLFHANWKAKKTVSTENPEWILNWYVNLDNKRGVSLHQYDLPGFPASHACMRLYEKDAHWFYDYMDQYILTDDNTIAAYGTPVIIFGSYLFNKRKPWLSLPGDINSARHTQQELEKEIEPFMKLIQQREIIRDSVITARQVVG